MAFIPTVRYYLYSRGSRQGLGEADHTHVVGILFEPILAVGTATTVQTGQARLLVPDPSTRVTTGEGTCTGSLRVGLVGYRTERIDGLSIHTNLLQEKKDYDTINQ